MSKQTIDPEKQRLISLSKLDLDYTELQDYLKDISEIAASIAGCNISDINLIDAHTQWTVANYGLEPRSTEREDTICTFTLLDDELEIKNLNSDERFADKFYVKGGPAFHYYYGVPLETSDGSNIGTLCVVNSAELELNEQQKKQIRMLAGTVVKRLEQLNLVNELENELIRSRQNRRRMAHDIRTPVNGIMGLSDMILSEQEEGDRAEVLKMVGMIRKGAGALMELAEETLAEPDVRNTIPVSNLISLGVLAEKLDTLYRPKAEAKGIRFRVHAESANETRSVPKKGLMHICGNLLSNALKFTPEEGSVRMDLFVKPGLGQRSPRFTILVEDTGIGISDEKIQQILQSAGSGSEQGTEGEHGYGIGMELVVFLIREMNGELDIRSNEGSGSIFEVSLPLNNS